MHYGNGCELDIIMAGGEFQDCLQAYAVNYRFVAEITASYMLL